MIATGFRTFNQCLLRVASTSTSALPTAPAPRPNSYKELASSATKPRQSCFDLIPSSLSKPFSLMSTVAEVLRQASSAFSRSRRYCFFVSNQASTSCKSVMVTNQLRMKPYRISLRRTTAGESWLLTVVDIQEKTFFVTVDGGFFVLAAENSLKMMAQNQKWFATGINDGR